MREILFRGKRKDNGEWIEGNLIRLLGGTVHISPVDVVVGYEGLSEFHEVIPETIGQFTGLTDKNGTKMFEGDIMRNAGNVIEFCSGVFCINGDSPLSLWIVAEVIGNIHDNPDLMNVK